MNPSLIFDIKRYAINDGPGVRTTVFFKGCSLACEWCHNPESHSTAKEKLYTAEKCIGCSDCVEACEQSACMLTPEGIVTNTELCILCGKCADVCPSKATEMSGEFLSIEEIIKVIVRDKPLMDESSGGVTFSGGEPLLHSKSLIQLLDKCGELGIHRCVDTSGFSNPEIILSVAERTDMFLYDLKLMDPDMHLKMTGIPNETILDNLVLLANTGVEMIIRIPLVKDVNDDEKNIQASAEYISNLPGETPMVNLLPYHNAALKKHEKLGHNVEANKFVEPTPQKLESLIQIFANHGIEATVGG